MSNFFKKARTDKVDRYIAPDGENWIELRAELSKAEANRILEHSPSSERDIRGGLSFYEYFYESTIVRWSATDEEGSPIAATVEAYRELEATVARWIDETLTKHLSKTLGSKVEELEGKSNNPQEM